MQRQPGVKKSTKQTFHERVSYEVADKVALITLNRPERLNAFDAAMYQGVNAALLAFKQDTDAWVAVLQAAGDRAFSAGADVNVLDDNARQGITSGLGGLLLDTEMITDKPIIGAVQGYCVGEGVNLMLGCDLVFADEHAQFMISEVRIGVNPVDIPIKLSQRLGYAKAFSFLAPGDAKSAAWMQDAGLVETVCPAGKVQEAARQFAVRLTLECAPLAMRAQKATLRQASLGAVEAAKQDGEARRTAIRQSNDYAEGRQAFLEKRTPDFTGK